MFKTKLLLASLALAFVAGCAKENNRRGIDPSPEQKASPSMTDSFSTVASSSDVTPVDPVVENKEFVKPDQYKIAIQKSALGKEFLLSTNILSQAPTPMFSGLQSRVVSFIERDGVVYMLDVTQNHKVGVGNTAQNILLAEFDIIYDDGFALTLDFNQGMRKIFTVGDWFASDDAGTSADLKLPFHQVAASYLDEVRLTTESLFVRQVAQVRITNGLKVEAIPYEVRYQFKPYLPDINFRPMVSPGFSKVGFFEANPLLLNDGTSQVYVSKWHDRKPIRFAISANTPEKYRGVVREGLLYWNKILGDNAIEVIQLTDRQISAPQFDMNIFQWAEWDGAGYAFADAHVDPRSGQITSAQIFFPSAFVDANVPKRLRLLHGDKEKSPSFGLKLNGFNRSHLCQRDVLKEFALGLEAKNQFNISDEAMEKAMMDYVYEVIAHEMGHILGLRHNFAGNLASNYDFKDRPTLIKSYYQNMKAPEGVVTSSSVMEYSRFEESAINGDMLRAGAPALTYDTMAIENLYKNKALPSARPSFCTDSQIGTYVDCNMGDAGRSVVSSAAGAYAFGLNTIAARVFNLFVSKTKYPDDVGQDLTTVDKVDVNAKATAELVAGDLAKLISLLKEDAQFIAVRGPKNVVLKTDEESLQQEEQKYLESEVQRLGGLKSLAIKFEPSTFADQFVNRFNELLNDPNYNSGTTRRGFKYSFSEDEKNIMRATIAKLSGPLAEQLIQQEIKSLSGDKVSFEASYGQSAPDERTAWKASVLADQLAIIQLDRLVQYSTEKLSETIQSEIVLKDGSTKGLQLPVYRYPQEIRLKSLGLLSNESDDKTWAFAEKSLAEKAIKTEGEAFGDLDNVDLVRLDRKALRWILDYQELEKAIAQ